MAMFKCAECGAEISDTAQSCVKCGAPVKPYWAPPRPAPGPLPPPILQSDPAISKPAEEAKTILGAEKRPTSAALSWGIFFIPYVFSWLTLRKGYSKLARGVAFSWLAICVFFIAAPHKPTGKSEAPVRVASVPAPAPQVDPNVCSPNDLQCIGNKGVRLAGVFCKDSVERLAPHGVKWTDGVLETKFSEFRWLKEENGSITYFGDKAEFQNSFGAYTPVVYECDMGRDGETVISARVSRGRLK